jgi:hypothetical protein
MTEPKFELRSIAYLKNHGIYVQIKSFEPETNKYNCRQMKGASDEVALECNANLLTRFIIV